MSAYNRPLRAPDPFAEIERQLDELCPATADERAAEALAKFRAQWPPERCRRLGRMLEGDYSQVWAEALAPKETDAPADAEVRRLSDAELRAHAKDHRRFNRQSDASMKLPVGMIDQMKGERK